MATLGDDIPIRRSANDPNEGLRLRLSGRPLPEPLDMDAEFRKVVLQRLNPQRSTPEKRGDSDG
jgi:hypothetical protein